MSAVTEDVRDILLDGRWHTADELAEKVGRRCANGVFRLEIRAVEDLW